MLFAGYVAIALFLIAYVIQRKLHGTPPEYTTGTWVSLGAGLVLLVVGSALLRWAYDWVLDGHARAACAMFVFLAVAALANSFFGFKLRQTERVYAWIYGAVGVAMLVVAGGFVALRAIDRSSFDGHLVLLIEAAEIGLFVVFWGVQTVERWHQTV